MFSVLWRSTIIALISMTTVPLCAHPVSLTDAVLDIRDDSTRLKLSITSEDLALYYELEPNKEFRIPFFNKGV